MHAHSRDWPDLDLDVPCCMSYAAQGPPACTCWEPIYDIEQATLDTGAAPGTQPAMCGDCAYRPGSPERLEDPHANVQGLDELHHLAAAGCPFYCHDGMRRVLAWHHPSGAVLTGETSEYDPPIRAGVPYQADGTPGLICGGWAARPPAASSTFGGWVHLMGPVSHDPLCRCKHMAVATDVEDVEGCDCALIARVVQRERERLAQAVGTTVHACPPTGEHVTPCCRRSPFELPLDDRITVHATHVTCRGAVR